MSIKRRGILAAIVAGSMAGGAVGATVLSATSSSAATGATTTVTAPPVDGNGQDGPPPGAQGGVFHPNENAGHEKGESAQREAQETAGKFPTTP